MIRRLYVHNFRCLENFELRLANQPSVLLIGSNGSGKTTVRLALEVLQKIARGTNRVGALVKPKDFFLGRTDAPMRFEIEVELQGTIYQYTIAFELPRGFRELRVLEENLVSGGQPVYTRNQAQVRLARAGRLAEQEANFRMDWHQVALPIVQESPNNPLFIFKQWLARMLILQPIPSLIKGESTGETLEPNVDAVNFAAWFSGLLASTPAAYARIDEYLKGVMPDMRNIRNPVIGRESRSLFVSFLVHMLSSPPTTSELEVPFEDLSDGEKCFMICALVLAASDANEQPFCFWDEPDSHLALSEIGHFVVALRKTFQSGGQFLMTSHNPEAIRRFSDENTLVLMRRSHLEPAVVRPLGELQVKGDLVGALIQGDVEA